MAPSYDDWKLASPPEGPECPECGGPAELDDDGVYGYSLICEDTEGCGWRYDVANPNIP